MEKTLLREEITKALSELGYDPLTEIQKRSIPRILDGVNLYLQAKTGSGKTAAYLIPALQMSDASSQEIGTLIVCPTRELAVQTDAELKRIAVYTGIRSACLIGGLDQRKQENTLRQHPQIIIGTPGRLTDLMEQGLLDLSHVRLLVMDEADQIRSTGQYQDMKAILDTIGDVQTVCLSATWSDDLDSWIDDSFETIFTDDPYAVNDRITEYRVYTKSRRKALTDILTHSPVTSAILFVNHRSDAAKLSEWLQKKGILASAFSAQFDERTRLKILSDFREGKIRVLCATDAAARGLDISEVSHIIHYDLPMDSETYIHRSGRTAHQGDQGISIILTTDPSEYADLPVYHSPGIENDLSIPLEKKEKASTRTQTLLIRAGRNDKIRPKDIIGALCTRLPFEQIGLLEIQNTSSTVTILNDDPALIDSLQDLTIKGKKRRIILQK